MRKLATVLMALALMTGFSAAVVGEEGPGDGPSITGEDVPEAGPGDKIDKDRLPDNVSKGPVDRAKGLAVAASKAPGKVVDSVIGPLQDGVKGLGNTFRFENMFGDSNSTDEGNGFANMFGLGEDTPEQAENGSEGE